MVGESYSQSDFLPRLLPWQISRVDYPTSTARYDAAFNAYHHIARENAKHPLRGGTPSVNESQG
jgi:hypothetical protein